MYIMLEEASETDAGYLEDESLVMVSKNPRL
jgi:hypothetical protein